MSPASSSPHLSPPPLRGALVPAGGTFPVAGLHRGITNLRAHDSAGTYLISVVSDPVHWTELAILVGPDHPWWGHNRSAGDRVMLGEVESSPAPPPARSYDQPGISPAVIQETEELLLRDFRDTGFVPLLSPEPPRNDAFVRRAAGLLQEAPDRTVSSVSVLIGLGIGFTPAGDDFLSGVILAEQILTRGALTAPERAAVYARLPATTAGGSSLLRVAAAGYPPAYQLRLVAALRAGEVAQAIDEARRHGHSSGLDALSGFVWKMRGHPAPEGAPAPAPAN
ncbi:MAG: DUF2877 domain-containing protein [Alkalispirochaeta sp.]